MLARRPGSAQRRRSTSTSRRPSASLLLTALLTALLTSDRALAHAPPEGITLVFQGDAAEARPVVLTTRGLAYPAGDPGAFSLRCSEAYLSSALAPLPTALGDGAGAVVVVSDATVQASSDLGCSWQPAAGLPGQKLGGFTMLPGAAHELLLSTLDYRQTSHIYASLDFGRTWTERATHKPAIAYDVLVAGPSGRVYAAGNRFDIVDKKLHPLWASSDDAGASFRELELETRRVPVGVHPLDPQRVFAVERISAPAQLPRDRLLRSDDGGLSFTFVRELRSVTAFASTPDGTHIWLGGEGGLAVSRDGGLSFQPVQESAINIATCLVYRGERLWLCGNMAPGQNGIWVSDDLGESFAELLNFAPEQTQLTQRVACGDDVICERPWADYAREQLGPAFDAGSAGADGGGAGDGGERAPADAAAPGADGGDDRVDAGVLDAAAEPPTLPPGARSDASSDPSTGALDAAAPSPRRRSDGCSAAPRAQSADAPLALALALAALLLARRRRSRR